MPGGGSFVAAKFMAEVAPKDGTVFGSLAQTLALDSMTNTTTKIDITKFNYLGRVVTNIDTGVTLPKSGIKSFDDVRAKQYVVGTSGGGSTTVLFPSALNAYARRQVQAGARLFGHDRHRAGDGARRGRHRGRLWTARHPGEPARLGHKRRSDLPLSGLAQAASADPERADPAGARHQRRRPRRCCTPPHPPASSAARS